ncbi:hypothetical protein KA089_01855 [Candidatus Woesebacteria bacterium]|nr:hypothetical protein [Candidatus Woesebacteria bacterium]
MDEQTCKPIGPVSVKPDPDKRRAVRGVYIEVGDNAPIPRGYGVNRFVVIERGPKSSVRLMTHGGIPLKFENKDNAQKFLQEKISD